MEVELDVTCARLLERFRWTQGHADVAGVLADAVLLGQLGPALAAPFRDEGVTALIDDADPDVRDDLHLVALVRSPDLPPSA